MDEGGEPTTPMSDAPETEPSPISPVAHEFNPPVEPMGDGSLGQPAVAEPISDPAPAADPMGDVPMGGGESASEPPPSSNDALDNMFGGGQD